MKISEFTVSGTSVVIYTAMAIIVSNMNTIGQKIKVDFEFKVIDRFKGKYM